LGSVVVELYPDAAPNTVANMLGYVGAGFYAGTIFHRVIPGFMDQGGGYTVRPEQLNCSNYNAIVCPPR
jgi:cyclophilin family peptidyl-prolyl cis-trans isomerase